MEYRTKPHRLIGTTIMLVSVVLLLSVLPITDTTRAESFDVYGWVYDSANGNEIENVKVTLFDPDTGEMLIDITNNHGEFRRTVSAGHYMIQYSHPRYVTSAEPLQMGEEVMNLGNIFLTKIAGQDATLTGHVEDSTGKDGKYAYVYLVDTNGANDGLDLFGQPQGNTIITQADKDGKYTFDNVYEGTFDLNARIGSSRYYFGNGTTITLTLGANVAPDIVYDDWSQGREKYVKVFNSKMLLVNNAEIIFYDPITNMWNSTTSNPSDVLILDGTYDLIVRADGYQTNIQQYTVKNDTHVDVYLEDQMSSMTVTDITVNTWSDLDYHSVMTNQFDHGPRFRSVEHGMFMTGIIRYDIERFFGNGDGTLSVTEANQYETFLESTIGPDGETTRNAFIIGSDDLTFSNFMVTFDEGSSDVRSMDTVQFDYTYDLGATIGDRTVYEVYYTLDIHIPENVVEHYENATFFLPAGNETVYEKICGSCDFVIEYAENDTTVVYINGTGDAVFHARQNTLPTPMIAVSDDFMPGDDTYLFRSDEYIEFDGSGSSDESEHGKILSYDWTFENVTGGNTNDTVKAVRMFDEGTYTVTLKVTDNGGGSAETSIYLIVDDTLPDVDFSIEPALVDQGTSENDNTRVYLNITTLNDANGIYDLFGWDLGNGIFTNITAFENRNVTYFYNELNITKLSGVNENEYIFTVTLTVMDMAGNKNSVTHDITVKSTRRPTAILEISDDMVPNDDLNVFRSGENITFNATLSSGMGAADIINYTWDFDDGTPDSYDTVVDHSYDTPGVYNAVLTVQDEYGATSTDNVTVYIDDAAPTVIFDITNRWMSDGFYFTDLQNLTNGEEDYLVNLSAVGTVDNGDVGDIRGLYEIAWAFEEPDKPEYKPKVNHNFSNSEHHYIFTFINNSAMNVTLEIDGVNFTHYYYTVTLTAWDLAGNNASFTRNIIVNDTEAPIAKFTYADEVDQGTNQELNGTTSKDNIGVVSYDWSIQVPNGTFDNRTGDMGGMVINYTFGDWGDYIVTLTVMDARGNNDTHESIITVNKVPLGDLGVTDDGIFFSKEDIYEGDIIDILANINNTGEKELFNTTVRFYWRANSNAQKELIGEYKLSEQIIVPNELRIANVTWEATKSGQIVVEVFAGKDPQGNSQTESDYDNNEAFTNVRVQDEDNPPPWGLIIGVSLIIIIIAGAALIFLFKPEWMGIRPAKTISKKSTGKSRKK